MNTRRGKKRHTRTANFRGDLEVATGAVAGAAAGAFAGPAGAVVGAGLGAAAAVLAHEALSTRDALVTAHERGLDATIGVTRGSLGVARPLDFLGPPGPSAWLRSEHDELEALATRALAVVEEGDPADVRALLAEVDRRLTLHMEGEEKELLSRYAEVNPEDAAAILAEHQAFRKLLLELGIAGDLHTVRLDRVRVLVDALRAHAKRENGSLYRWAAASALAVTTP